MSIERFIREDIFLPRLRKAQVLAVYDPDRRYRDICLSLGADDTRVVDTSEGSLSAREMAMLSLSRLGGSGEPALLVYVPAAVPVTEEQRVGDPFYVYAVSGDVFPGSDGDSYLSLCLKAKPDHSDEVRRLFAENPSPSFALIDNVGGGLSWPTLRTCLRAESAREIALALLAPTPSQRSSLDATDGWVPEARALFSRSLGLVLQTRAQAYSAVADELWRFVLFSEFVFDLPASLPASLSNVPRAAAAHRVFVEDLCDALRSDSKFRNVYIGRAEEVEKDLVLAHACAGIDNLGVRDTFPFEERTFLSHAVRALTTGDLDRARALVEQHRGSVWIAKGESRLQWDLVEAGLRLLASCADAGRQLSGSPTLDTVISQYATTLREVDTLQREFEQAVADYIRSDDLLSAGIEHCRARYARFADMLQSQFIRQLETAGWPSPGLLSNGQVFDKVVAPLLAESGRKVAFIMVDALRYELGVALQRQLADSGQVELRTACAQLPTVTPVGMVSLLPGAASGLRLIRDGDGLSVTLEGNAVITVADRMEVLKARYGDRFFEMKLEDFIRPKIQTPALAELLVLRTIDIDALLENTSSGNLATLRLIHQSLQMIQVAVNKLKGAGFSDVVIATDHGFVLNAHAEAGDVCGKPPGAWVVVHDRAVLGDGEPDTANFAVPGEKLGVQGDFFMLGGPRSMAPYRKGLLYFHGGASLQEAVVPVITVKLKTAVQAKQHVHKVALSYKGGATKITTRVPVVDLMVEGESLFADEETFRVLLEAHDKKGATVGEAKRGGAVDVATGVITLKPGARLQVAVKMIEEYQGRLTLKVLNPVTLTQYAALDLETDYAV